MRILQLNWARIWHGVAEGGGVNGYCQGLALAFTRQGHEVSTLASGRTYSPDPEQPSAIGPTHIVRHDDWLGIRCFEIVNSPVLAPSSWQFADPEPEIESEAMNEAVAGLLEKLEPDLVHVHSLEGFGAGVIDVVRRAGCPVVMSLHNYHTICPEVFLLHGDRELCFDDEGGLRCETCIDGKWPDTLRRSLAGLPELPDGSAAPDAGSDLEAEPVSADPSANAKPRRSFPLRLLSSSLGRGRSNQASTPPTAADAPAHVKLAPVKPATAQPPTASPRLPVESARDANEPRPPSGRELRGTASAIGFFETPQFVTKHDDPEWQPRPNDPGSPPSEAANVYGRRRDAMIAALNRCDAVLAVSSFVEQKFARMGVERDRLSTVHIGTAQSRMVAASPELVFDPPPIDGQRPIRLVFIGDGSFFKGLHVLADALELVSTDTLSKIALKIVTSRNSDGEPRFRRLEPRLASLKWQAGYTPFDIVWHLGGQDLGVVPSVWWDNGPQTVMELLTCGVPVLGADIGGIPDFVEEGRDGFLFRANDRRQLAERLEEIVGDPTQLSVLRRTLRRPAGIDDHAREMADLYASMTNAVVSATSDSSEVDRGGREDA